MKPASDTLYRTERLLVRRLGPADFDAMYAVYSDRGAMRHVDDGEPIGRESCRRWIDVTERNYASRGYGMAAVQLADSRDVIGFCGLVHPGGQHEAELKYAYLREHWGRGYATEAAIGMLRYGLSEHGLRRVIATTAAGNAASHRVLEKSGMRDTVGPLDDGERGRVFEWTATGARG